MIESAFIAFLLTFFLLYDYFLKKIHKIETDSNIYYDINFLIVGSLIVIIVMTLLFTIMTL